MRIDGVNGNSMGMQMSLKQGMDAVSRDLQNQIAMAQKEMQKISGNKEMSLEEKNKKLQELQKQISDLQNQLRRHQMEQRRESRQKKESPML